MAFFYISFCHLDRAAGQQFVGAAVVEAPIAELAVLVASALGINPGGEAAIVELDIDDADQIPLDGRAYLNRLVPRNEVTIGQSCAADPPYAAVVCQQCNPPVEG